jgi:hypothetical protein
MRCGERLHARASENFEVVFVLGARTSVVGRSASRGQRRRRRRVQRRPALRRLRCASPFYATAAEHAFELGAVEVRVEPARARDAIARRVRVGGRLSSPHSLERALRRPLDAQTLGRARPARCSTRCAARAAASRRLRRRVSRRAADCPASRSPTSSRCRSSAPAAAAPRSTVRRSTSAVAADSNTPRNQLLVGIADGLESGAHVVGFARGDRTTAPALGARLAAC